ncbi:hypothetical protein ACFYZ8_33395 [Streptomyces sp. NPDC001668]|uniref:hypothetical protein n=1 Tax=Streptomyces sp. NPDC001668 TaxID=3364598 RepID=UPI0036C9DCD3
MIEYTVEGAIEFRPSVPLAQLWELTASGRFSLAPAGATEAALNTFVEENMWVLVPDPDGGTDEQDRPRRVQSLRVVDMGIHSYAVKDRLAELSAWIGQDHELVGCLEFWGDDEGDLGVVVPVAGGGCPSWRLAGDQADDDAIRHPQIGDCAR